MDHRIVGFVPIEDYAVLGDGRSVALVASDGSVDWWPIPTIDSPPLCAAVLDPEDGGFFLLAPRGTLRRHPGVPARHQRARDHLHHSVRIVSGDRVPHYRFGWSASLKPVRAAG